MKRLSVFITVIGLLALLSLSACHSVTAGTPAAISSNDLPPTTTASDLTSTSVTAESGLKLTLSLNSIAFQTGDEVAVTISEENTLSSENNVPVADLWPVRGLSVGPCGVVNYPFGVAILQGDYDAESVADVMLLVLYNPDAVYYGPCVLAGIVSSTFHPLSDTADIYTEYDSMPVALDMSAGVNVKGYWSGSSSAYSNFAPGVYTVVGADEWGTLAILHFTVS